MSIAIHGHHLLATGAPVAQRHPSLGSATPTAAAPNAMQGATPPPSRAAEAIQQDINSLLSKFMRFLYTTTSEDMKTRSQRFERSNELMVKLQETIDMLDQAAEAAEKEAQEAAKRSNIFQVIFSAIATVVAIVIAVAIAATLTALTGGAFAFAVVGLVAAGIGGALSAWQLADSTKQLIQPGSESIGPAAIIAKGLRALNVKGAEEIASYIVMAVQILSAIGSAAGSIAGALRAVGALVKTLSIMEKANTAVQIIGGGTNMGLSHDNGNKRAAADESRKSANWGKFEKQAESHALKRYIDSNEFSARHANEMKDQLQHARKVLNQQYLGQHAVFA